MALKLDMSKSYDRIEWPFVVEVFSSMGLLKKERFDSRIHGIKIARRAPVISHLLFGDDSLIFARANSQEPDKILDILQKYQVASEQIVNLDKFKPSFSHNVSVDEQNVIRGKMGVQTVSSYLKYLGLPVVFGRSKRAVFALVIERVWNKIKVWKEKFLSRAGKEELIKVVAQAIPSYIMSCYKLPEIIFHEIEAMIMKFL
ncbi:unnamed protein product [Vicia faba]|uniref:Reverse transcriptase n=1 Tax=Vicia faba TaxID=3906 RepID=A0AAV0Z1K3_VICFA|nr:unnamed protein product [Vicia faba]